MFKLFKNLKPLRFLIILVFILVATQAVAELYLPEMMSDIINDGLYLDYEPMYDHLVMDKPKNVGGIDSSIKGYDDETMPVFEMQDGFSTYDLGEALRQIDPDVDHNFVFQDIPVRDSKLLFEEILMPFLDGLEPYQKANNNGKKYDDHTPEIQAEIRFAINRLIVFDSLTMTNSGGGGITVDSFLDFKKASGTDGANEDNDVLSNDTTRKILTACFIKMKHSPYGNILPIPLDKDGNRMSVDSYGRAIENSKLVIEINEDTGRPELLPDFELIICNKVLGYAYKYVDGVKWINHKLGISEEKAQIQADKYNKDNNIKVKTTAKIWQYLKFSPRGGVQREEAKAREMRTAKDMQIPDGKTIQRSDFNFILLRGAYMLLLTLLASVCAIVASNYSAKIAADFSSTIRSNVFGKVETFSLVEFDKFSTASLITRSTNDINQIQNVFLMILRTTLAAPVTIIGGVILSSNKNSSMTMTILYALPILIVASVVAAKIVFPIFDIIQTKVDRLTLLMRESLSGIRVIRAFNQQDREKKRFADTNASLTKSAISVNRYTAILAPLIAVVMNCTMVGVVWVASKSIANDDGTDVGDMMAVIQYITQIMMALVMLATVFVMFPRASASAKRINQVVDTPLTIIDKENAKDAPTCRADVEFKDVNFKYAKDAECNILSNISFKASKGKVTAIVGGTGTGKSSIINLIPRFYDVTEGSILIDGQDIRDIPQHSLRAKIGFIPQRSVLFSGTIADNLRYGKEDATEEEMWDALTIAQSDTFVREKENGLQSKVEQGGRNFSGGQKQRLAIARALVRKPEILIFDDSFSALDFKTDSRLRRALKTITTQSAVIIVAQRIGTIMDADNILVIEQGKIIGSGTHQHLIHNCKLYRDIALSQMSAEELGL